MSSRVKKRQSIIMHLKTIRYFLFIEFSFSLSLSIFTLAAFCEAQWTSFGSSCYKLYNSTQRWKNAKLNCQKFGSMLVKIDSDKESKFLEEKYLRKGRRRYWIGLSDFDEGEWIWTDGTRLTGYTNWEKGQPNDYGNQDCGVIKSNAKWGDNKCWLQLGYICEKFRGVK